MSEPDEDQDEPGTYRRRKPKEELVFREAAAVYGAEPEPRPRLRVVRGALSQPTPAKGGGKMKTSVYLEPADIRRLSWLAGVEQRSQAEIIRAAIRSYTPATDSDFELFRNAPEQEQRPTPVAEGDFDRLQEKLDRLMEGFGQDTDD